MSLDKDNERKNGEELENTQPEETAAPEEAPEEAAAPEDTSAPADGNRRRRPKTRTGGSKRPIPPKPKRF